MHTLSFMQRPLENYCGIISAVKFDENHNLKHFLFFEMHKKDSGHEQIRSRDATESPP